MLKTLWHQLISELTLKKTQDKIDCLLFHWLRYKGGGGEWEPSKHKNEQEICVNIEEIVFSGYFNNMKSGPVIK